MKHFTKMKSPVKDFFSKFDQIRSLLNGKLYFLCREVSASFSRYLVNISVTTIVLWFRMQMES